MFGKGIAISQPGNQSSYDLCASINTRKSINQRKMCVCFKCIRNTPQAYKIAISKAKTIQEFVLI